MRNVYHATKHWVIGSSRLDFDKLGDMADIHSLTSLLNFLLFFLIF